MNFIETRIAGCLVLEIEPHSDERGFFGRTFCREEFIDRGLNPDIVQSSLSFNARAGTLRGLHYQVAPFEETKIVHCIAGIIHDVVLDIREDSSTCGEWIAVELHSEQRRMLYVPAGCAHGFQTLRPDTEVLYHISAQHSPAHSRGIRWNDPAFKIDWPLESPIVSERDRAFPDYSSQRPVVSSDL